LPASISVILVIYGKNPNTFYAFWEEYIKLDSYTGSFAKEIHVVTYQGRVEAVSYAENAEMQAPKIDLIFSCENSLFFIIEFSTLEWCGFGGITM
jgi:hypothetical protein